MPWNKRFHTLELIVSTFETLYSNGWNWHWNYRNKVKILQRLEIRFKKVRASICSHTCYHSCYHTGNHDEQRDINSLLEHESKNDTKLLLSQSLIIRCTTKVQYYVYFCTFVVQLSYHYRINTLQLWIDYTKASTSY